MALRRVTPETLRRVKSISERQPEASEIGDIADLAYLLFERTREQSAAIEDLKRRVSELEQS
jgi:hypothetical protein